MDGQTGDDPILSGVEPPRVRPARYHQIRIVEGLPEGWPADSSAVLLRERGLRFVHPGPGTAQDPWLPFSTMKQAGLEDRGGLLGAGGSVLRISYVRDGESAELVLGGNQRELARLRRDLDAVLNPSAAASAPSTPGADPAATPGLERDAAFERPRPRRKVWLIAAALAAAVIVALGVVSLRSRAPGSGLAAAPAATATAPAAPSTAAAQPTAAAPPESVDPAEAEGRLRGFGMTNAAWGQGHVEITPSQTSSTSTYIPPGSMYVGLNGQAYLDVAHDRGRVVAYRILVEAPGISREDALQIVQGELPTDATQVYDVPQTACERLQYRSPAAGALFASAGIKGAEGLIAIRFKLSRDPLRPSDPPKVVDIAFRTGVPGDRGELC